MIRQAEQATCLKQASRIMTQGMYIPSHFKPESLSRLEVATLAHRKGRSDENSECRGAIALSAREVWEVQSPCSQRSSPTAKEQGCTCSPIQKLRA